MNMTEVTHVNLDPVSLAGGKFYLTGSAAMAKASLDSGVRFFASYPGSPITEVLEIMVKAKDVHKNLHAEISINESSALFGATGASWSGARVLVTMKHVGLHVSCDPFAYLGYTGTRGGLVLGVGIDPGARCSTGEFDIRHLVHAYHWVMLEPSNVREVYDYTGKAFSLSERWKIPVMIVMPTELCTQYGTVDCDGHDNESMCEPGYEKGTKYISNDDMAIGYHRRLISTIHEISVNSGEFIDIEQQDNANTVIISSGCNLVALREAMGLLGITSVDVIKCGMTYPLPEGKLSLLLNRYNRILIVEELDGFLSSALSSLAGKYKLRGEIKNLNGDFLSAGSLSQPHLLKALSREFAIDWQDETAYTDVMIPPRPGTFCPGCMHRGILYTIQRTLGENDIYGGDIGCSSLPPYYSDWLTCMGSGLGIAHGVATISRKGRVIASMGDSTFFHCGMPIILNAIEQQTDITLLILDNRWTAMTGHQPLPHTRDNTKTDITKIVKALGADQVWEVDAYQINIFRELLIKTKEYSGVKIIIIRGECRLKFMQTVKREKRQLPKRTRISEDRCHQCGECYENFGCMAIEYEDDTYRINEALCQQCGICAQVCPNNAISLVEYLETKCI